jgi:hypothetical protein
MKERRIEKIEKYKPLLNILKRELSRGGRECNAISIAVLESITTKTVTCLCKLLEIEETFFPKILRDINIELVRETIKI